MVSLQMTPKIVTMSGVDMRGIKSWGFVKCDHFMSQGKQTKTWCTPFWLRCESSLVSHCCHDTTHSTGLSFKLFLLERSLSKIEEFILLMRKQFFTRQSSAVFLFSLTKQLPSIFFEKGISFLPSIQSQLTSSLLILISIEVDIDWSWYWLQFTKSHWVWCDLISTTPVSFTGCLARGAKSAMSLYLPMNSSSARKSGICSTSLASCA